MFVLYGDAYLSFVERETLHAEGASSFYSPGGLARRGCADYERWPCCDHRLRLSFSFLV